jgi:hypothetical protein
MSEYITTDLYAEKTYGQIKIVSKFTHDQGDKNEVGVIWIDYGEIEELIEYLKCAAAARSDD